MAITQIFKRGDGYRINLSDISVPSGLTTVGPNVPVIAGGKPAVTITGSGNYAKTVTSGLPAGVTSVTYDAGGEGLAPTEVSVNYENTYELPVTGVTDSTSDGVQVYIDSAGDLTTTAGSNVPFGRTQYPKDYVKRAGFAPVWIGA